MHDTRMRLVATKDDIDRLDIALRALSAALGDIHTAGREDLAAALCGPHRVAFGLLAECAGQVRGAALFSPVYSTVKGAAGVYVSDLWVSEVARGQGLGRRILAKVAREGAALWRADWLKLAVYDHSTESQQFYHRLGFQPAQGIQEMRLDARAVAELIKRAG